MYPVFVLITALSLDYLLGEPSRWHPLAGFGKLASQLEQTMNRQQKTARVQMLSGFLCLLVLVMPVTFAGIGLLQLDHSQFLLDSVLLYLTLGARSLREHAQRVGEALASGDIQQARIFTSHIVSRDTAIMDEAGISRATIESTLENGNDAIFAPLFWFVIGGAPAALFYRLVNTLDAMWGYKTERYLYFGRSAARLDDLLNYLPARLTAFSYAITGKFQTAIQCWRSQASLCKSPNGGPVMSAGAGALSIRLGGPAHYHGKLENCPLLGCGQAPQGQHIHQAIALVQRSMLLWVLVISLITGGLQFA